MEIKKISDEVVCVTTKIEKTVRNKTKASKSLPCWYEVEEYKFANGSTKIVECGIKTDTDEAVSRDQIEREHHVEVKTREVSIPPDKTAQIWAEAIQYRRTNDNVWETFRTPILNPEIEVIIDDNEFSHVIQFGTYGDVSKSHYRNHYTLSGVYFPGQFMFVRWWPKSPPESDPPKST